MNYDRMKQYKMEDVFRIVKGLDADISSCKKALMSLRGKHNWEDDIEKDTRAVVQTIYKFYNQLNQQREQIMDVEVAIPEPENAGDYLYNAVSEELDNGWDNQLD